MKVLVVATNRARFPYPVAPLGVLCVTAAARAAGHNVELLDLGLANDPRRALAEFLSTAKFDAVALGIRNLDNCWAFDPRWFFDETRELADTISRHFSGPLILGGTGFSVSPLGWMRRLGADYGVVGEGERAFPELLSALENGSAPQAIEGVITADQCKGTAVISPAKPVEKMNSLPLPAHDLCHYPGYLRRGGFVSVQTKRGCPFKCSYCVYPFLEGRRYRLRPPELVVDEIEMASRRGKLRDFFFVDSVFNDPRRHALAICREITRRALKIRWSAFCNPAGFDHELARAMKEAGCAGVEFGLDVASDKMLEALQKPFGQKEIRVALNAARKAGLPFAAFMLFGGPGETWKDIEDTQSFLNDCPAANAVFATYGIRVYEGAPIAETAVREGQTRPGQDLFEPAYYLSPHLAKDTNRHLDVIARRRAEWTSPIDWQRLVCQWGQKLTVLMNVRPQWKHLRYYGAWTRRKTT